MCYIAGTRGVQDVLDWRRRLLKTFNESKIYQHVEPDLVESLDTDTFIGHSTGGSTTLELKDNCPDKQ